MQDRIASRWIVGFEFQGSGLRVRYVDLHTGSIHSDSLANFGHYLHFGEHSVSRLRVSLHLEEATRALDEDISVLCRTELHAGARHALFRFSLPGLGVVVPAQVLTLALFGQTARMRAALASPLGAERLLLPTSGKNKWELHDTQVKPVVSAPENWEQQRLNWTLHHPSARAAFCSFYLHAKAGRMDVDLPQGTVDAAVTGIRLASGALLVTRLTVFELRTTESEIGCKGGVAKSFAFRSRGHVKRAMRTEVSMCRELQGLRCVTKGLTQAQWRAAMPVVLKASPRALFLPAGTRASLNTLLLKYGLPCSWEEVKDKGLPKDNAMGLRRKLKRAGVWSELVRLIRVQEAEKAK